MMIIANKTDFFYPVTGAVKRGGRSSDADLLQAGHEIARYRVMIDMRCFNVRSIHLSHVSFSYFYFKADLH